MISIKFPSSLYLARQLITLETQIQAGTQKMNSTVFISQPTFRIPLFSRYSIIKMLTKIGRAWVLQTCSRAKVKPIVVTF